MFNNPNLFAGYLVLIFPLALFYAFNSFSLLRVPLWIITSLSIIALVLSRSKNAWMAFALLLICMGIFFVVSYARKGENTSSGTFFNWKWISVFTVCFIMILGSFCFTLKKGTVSEILKEDLNWNVPIEQKLDIRLALWKHAVQMIEDFPLFGVGTGRFNLAFPRYSSGYPWDKAVITPHNHFLKITAELGLLGLYAFLWMVWTILAKGFQIIRQKQDVIRRGVWFGILGFVLTFFGDNHLWNIEMQLLFFLMLGLLFVDEGRDETARVHPGSFNQKLLAGLSAIILLTLPFQIYQRSHISFLSERSLGLYQEKFNDGEREYQWGEKVILIPLEKEGNRILIPMKLGNPDIQRHPVHVKIFLDGQLADTLEFRDHDWHLLRYSIHGMKGPEVFLKIEASRTWNPYLSGVRHETRDLGLALGKIAWSS